jgi:Carboxypeptidase regulatory-like domain
MELGKRLSNNRWDGILRDPVRGAKWAWWILALCVSSSLALAQAREASGPPQPGSISGTVVDRDGAVVSKARITLAQEGAPSTREALSDDDGYFVFEEVAPGPFQITVSASGFATQAQSGVLQAGQDFLVPQITLVVAPADVNVEVTVTPEQVAEDQVKVEETQRLFGVIPNYYVTYVPNAAPLTTKLKFQLAWKNTVDPVTFAIVGGIAGIEQADNAFSGYGQGAQGYAKRYGAAYADLVSGTFIGGAILPSLLKQDPRYFYKGTGSRRSRLLYAIANAVICKGDNGHWQPNYSSIIGGLAAGGISNLYYPASNRNGAALTFENGLIATGAGALGNIIEEFFLRKITPHAGDPNRTKN